MEPGDGTQQKNRKNWEKAEESHTAHRSCSCPHPYSKGAPGESLPSSLLNGASCFQHSPFTQCLIQCSAFFQTLISSHSISPTCLLLAPNLQETPHRLGADDFSTCNSTGQRALHTCNDQDNEREGMHKLHQKD